MFWKDTRNHHIPHMMMTLKGRLKGENNLWWHCVLFEDQTKIWIPTRKWVIRIIYSQCKLENYERGLLLSRDNGRHASIGYYDPMFRIFSEWGQNLQPKLFTTRVFIGDFSLIIIPRSGANMEAECFLETVAIELINPQRKKEEERGKYSGLSMWQVYTQVYIAVVDSLHFSQSH